MRINQLYAAFIPGDAVCNHMLEIDARLRAWGFQTCIYAGYIAPQVADQARPDREYETCLNAPDDLLIYHYGLYTPNIHYFHATRGRRILVYHNITPARYFRGWDREQELLCDMGRRALSSLTGCDLALGDSDYNRRELVEAGVPEEKTGVLPVFLTSSHFDVLPAERALLDRLREQAIVNFLTVGRVVPSKAIEDVIRIFYIYHRAINPRSRLYIIGARHMPAYDAALDALVAEMQLGEAVVFTGLVSDAELKTYYQAADFYLTASYHEGFCVPILESMYFDVPILARKAAAMPETLGGAGVLFTHLGYREVAEMAHLLVTDERLRQQVIRGQKERLAAMGPEQAEAALRHALARVGIHLARHAE
jgi:glycosyltransferase involved in cell wall biosynthesis